MGLSMSAPQKKAEELLSACTWAVVRRRTDEDTTVVGTAFLVSSSGHFLTAGHLIAEAEGTDQVSFRAPDGKEHPITVLKRVHDDESGADYALCKVKLSSGPALPLSFARSPRGSATSRGFGQTTGDASPSTGNLIGSLDVDGKAANRLFLYISQQAGDPGFSGSAVFSQEAGGVVAIQTEASASTTGPHRDTVLTFPVFHLRELLAAHVDLWTRAGWLIRSALLAAAARPWRLLATFCIVMLFCLGSYYAFRLVNTFDRLALFGRPEYLILDSQESVFWGSPVADAFNASGPNLKTDFTPFVRANKIDGLVISLDAMYESIARCTNEDVCLEQPVCPVMYSVLWGFYSRYWPFLDDHYALLNRGRSPETRKFLRTKCAVERKFNCDKVGDQSDVCLTTS